MKKNNPYSMRVLAIVSMNIACLPIVNCDILFQPRKNPGMPIVVLTFDDAHPSVYSYSYPTMRSFDSTWGATHFLPVTYALPGGVMTVEQLKEMEAHGWETGGHGYNHENLSSAPLDSAEKQIKESYDFLAGNGLSCESFAYPYGNYNASVAEKAKKYFKNIRTSHDFEYLDGVSRTELGYYVVKPGAIAEDAIGRLEKARHNGSPLVVIGFHAVIADTEPPPDMYWCRRSALFDLLTYLKKEEYPVLTLKKAMNELCK